MTHTAPSKEYHQRLIALSSEQYASGNRNGVGCSSTVIRKISSEARLAMQCDKDLIMSVQDRIVTCYRADAVDHQNYTTRQQYTLMQANSSENSQSHHILLSFQHTCMLIYTYT